MDQSSFDRLARLLGGATTRRAGVRAALGAIIFTPLGILAAGRGREDRPEEQGAEPRGGDQGSSQRASTAKQKDKGRNPARDRGRERPRDRTPNRPTIEGPCGDGTRSANACASDAQCCTGLCNMNRSKRNVDGLGRCRCQRGGRPCKEDRNCCDKFPCENGTCGGPPPTATPGPTETPTPVPTATPTPTPTPIATGQACIDGGTPCADAKAACMPYDKGAIRGTFCLLPFKETCTADTECQNRSCSLGVCVGCSCSACPTDTCVPDVCSTCAKTTIQAAIDDAANGDVIYIAPGIYEEDVSISDVNLTLVGCPGGETIIRNATIGSRAIEVSDTSKLELVDIVVEGKNNDLASEGGGILTSGDLTLCRFTVIRGNRSPDSYGGGVHVAADVSAPVLRVFDGTVIEGNRAGYGGGVGVRIYATLIIDDDVVIQNNTGDSFGGGAYVDSGAKAIIRGNAKFLKNTAANNGGLTYYGRDPGGSGTAIDISGNVLFDENSADSYGGGLGTFYCEANGNESISIRGNVTFTNNHAQKGGAVYSIMCRVSISDQVKMSGNTADTYGAGIHVQGPGDTYGVMLDITDDVEISNNVSDSYGGGIFIEKAYTRISGRATIKDNSATNGGGAINASESSILIQQSAKLTGNSTDSYGGAIYTSYNPLTIVGDVEISGNTGGYGGAIALWRVYDSYSAYIGGNVKFTGNTAKIIGSAPGQGGAIFAMNSNVVLARKADVSGNTAEGEGGGVALVKDTIGGVTDPANLEITGQASITGNTSSVANGGGGVWAEDTASVVTAPAGSISSNTPDQCVGSSSADCTA